MSTLRREALTTLYNRVNESYFAGRCRARVTFAKLGHSTMGLHSPRLIEVNEVLHDAPDYVIECVLYHEMLHEMGHDHGPEMAERESRYPRYKEALEWIAQHW